jgi:hypothetical protein
MLFGIQAVEECRHPSRCEEVEAVVRYVAASREPGDAVYVYYGAKPAVEFYAARLNFDVQSALFGDENRHDVAEYYDELDAIPARRLWVIVSHRRPGEVRAIVEHLERTRDLIAEHEVPGAAAYLFIARE